MSFTFTKRDERSPNKDYSKTYTEESKIEQLEIEECSPDEFPSVKVPKRFVTSGTGVAFEKNVFDKMQNMNKLESSRNNSSVPYSRSHKASIVMPKVSRGDSSKNTPIAKKNDKINKPYSDNHNFQ